MLEENFYTIRHTSKVESKRLHRLAPTHPLPRLSKPRYVPHNYLYLLVSVTYIFIFTTSDIQEDRETSLYRMKTC